MADDTGDGRNQPPGKAGPALESAPAGDLERALASDFLQPHQVLLILRNPAITPALIQRIGRRLPWMKSYKVRTSLVLHLKTPRPLGMSLVSSLRWGDLARVAAACRLPMALRTAAESILLLRLPELALGERVSLARVATPSVVRGLRGDDSPLVVQALLENASLRFEEALFIAERAEAPPALLSVLAESRRFARRHELRLALAAHPCTPPAVALRLVAGLEQDGLATLATSDGAPVLVRVAAERRLSAGLTLSSAAQF